MRHIGTRKALIRKPFSPLQLRGLKYWFRADALNLNDTDLVGTWLDVSGNHHDVTQVTTAAKPQYKKAVFNGQPALLFDGVDDALERSTVGLQTGGTHTLFFVAAPDVTTAGNKRMLFDNGYLFGRNTAKLEFTTRFVQDYTTSSSYLTAGVASVIAYGFDAAFAMTFWHNGVNVQTVTGSSDTGGNVNFRVGSSTGSEFWGGHIAEIAAFAPQLSATEMRQMFFYLNRKYKAY